MNREAIKYVKDAEARASQLRKDADDEIKQIELEKAKEIESIQSKLETELSEYKSEQEQIFSTKLDKDQAEMDESASREAERFEKAYQEKKQALANRIAEEVVRRYGNR